MLFLIGLLLIGIGLLNIFAKDFVWELTAFGNRLEGQRSERTETWEIGTALSGIVFSIIGLVMMLNS